MKIFFKYGAFLILAAGMFVLGVLYSGYREGNKEEVQNTESRVVIEDLEDRIVSTLTHSLTGTVISVVKGDRVTRLWNDESRIPSVGYETKVVIKKLGDQDNYGRSIYYDKNSYDPIVSGFQFSPNGKYVSFSINVIGYKTSYLFNLDTYLNLIRRDEYIIGSPLEWSQDSLAATFKSEFNGYGGEGYDGNVKFDAKTDNFYKI